MANVGIFDLTDTWNAGGTTFNAIKMDVTDTASAAGSKLLDLLVGGASKFSVDKAGNVAAAGTLNVTGASTLAALGATNGTFSGTLASTGNFSVNTDKFTVAAATGNTVVAGTLGVTGAATFTAAGVFNAGIGRCGGGINVTAIGFNAKARGAQDTGIGESACGGNTADGNYTGLANTCVGQTAGQALTTATQSVFVGSTAGSAVTTGNSNVLIGHGAGLHLTTGTRNHCIGAFAGRGQNFGNDNILIGHNCARDITGSSNIVLKSSTATTGYLDDLAGSNQINIGDRYFHDRIQLKNAASGAGDCILLREAANELAMRNGINAQTFRLYNTYTDDSNYERGYLRWDADILKIGTEEEGSGTERAMELQTDGVTRVTIPAAAGRIFVGDMIVGRGGQTAVVTNTALGALALNSASLTGSLNTAIGYSCLNALTTAIQCTAVGGQALSANTTGTDCVAVGFAALAENTTASNNVAVGSQTLRRCTGADNVAIGSTALSLSTTGTGNCALGRSAGFVLSGSNNTLIGRSAGAGFTRGVATLGAITGGSGYTDGSYSGVALTYSSGSRYQSNPTANITVSGGAVTAVTVVSEGTGFQATDTVLTASAANLGGTGSGFSVAVASLTGAAASNNTLIGFQAGDNLTQGSGNIVIGSGVDADSDTGSNQINIGDRFYHDRIRLLERSSDPTKPTEGNTVVWMSDGSGLGDDGDVLIASTAGGVTNYAILFDHSAGTLWS